MMSLYGIPYNLLILSFILHTYVPEYSCNKYDVYNLNKTSVNDTCTITATADLQDQICKACAGQEIEFSSKFTKLMTYDYELYCDRKLFSLLVSIIHFVGIIVLMPVSSYCSENYGRWLTTAVGNVLVVTLCISLYFTNSFWQIVLIKFLVVPIGLGVYNCMCTVHLETYASPRMKPIFGSGVYLHGPFTLFICGLMAKYFSSWKQVQLVLIIFYAIIAVLCLFVMETPTYLLGKGQTKAAERQLKKMGKINRIAEDQLDFEILPTQSEFNLEQKISFFDIWRQGKATTVLNLAVFGSYLAAYNVYWGFSLNIGILPVSLEMGFYVTGIVGCIGGFINIFVNFFVIGRRKLIQIYLAVSLISVSLALMFEAIGRSKCKFGDIKSVWTILNLSASFIGIAAVVALWFLLNFVIVELYAPQICITAYSWLVTFGNIGGLLGPVYYSAFYQDVVKVDNSILMSNKRSVSALYD